MHFDLIACAGTLPGSFPGRCAGQPPSGVSDFGARRAQAAPNWHRESGKE